MKTKHILTAIALPSLLAACTNEEFENLEFTQPQSERPVLGDNFTLKVTSDGEGAESRYAVEGDQILKSKFETNDKIAAAIIDTYDPAKKPELWDISYGIGGMQKFTFNAEDNKWSAEDNLGVGHYLFTFPYNPNDKSRSAVSYSIPTVQKLYQTEDGELDINAAVEKGNKAIFASLLDVDDTELEAQLINVYSYPKFVINFDNGQNVTTVSQVILEYTGEEEEGFEVKGGFDHKKVWERFKDPKTKWEEVQTADLLIDEGSDEEAKNYTEIEHSKYIIAKLPNNTKVQTNSVTNNKFVEVRFMMPGALAVENSDYATKLQLHVYTDNGVYTYNESNVYNSISWKTTTTKAMQARAFARNASYTLNMKPFTTADKEKEVDAIVTTVKDWNKLVADYGNAENKVVVKVVGDEFKFNEESLMPSKNTFIISTAVKVDGDVTMKNVTINNRVTVEEGATLTTSGTFNATTVENNGTLKVVAKYNDDKVVNYVGVKNIVNNGTLNVAKEAVAGFALINNKNAKVKNNGEITIQNINTASGDKGNYGTINNNGTINIAAGDFTNEAREYDKDVIVNEPTINVAKDAKILAKDGTLTNNSLIVNEGVITCKNLGGEVNNSSDAVLDSKEGALTYMTNNQGKVIVYSENTINLTIGGNSKGIVEYETSKDKVDLDGSLVNSIVASKSLALSNASGKSVTFKGDATLTLDEKTTSLNKIIVKAGKTTVVQSEKASSLDVASIEVAEKAMLIVPEKTTIKLTSKNLVNDGTILVGGSFIAHNVSSSNSGKVEENGSNANIEWKENSDSQEARKSFETATNRMVQAWIIEKNELTSWDDVKNLTYNNANWASDNQTELEGKPTWKELANEAMKAYNNYKSTNYTDVKGFVKDVIESSENQFVDDLIDSYKAKGNTQMALVINNELKDNQWIGESVYTKTSAGDTEFQKEMFEAFAEYISVNHTNWNVDLSTDKNEDEKNTIDAATAICLNAITKADVKLAMIPDYSYIHAYANATEGHSEYELFKILASFEGKLYKGWSFQGYQFDETNTIQKLVSSLYNKVMSGNELTEYQKQIVKNTDFMKIAPSVTYWKFTTEQMSELKEIVLAE